MRQAGVHGADRPAAEITVPPVDRSPPRSGQPPSALVGPPGGRGDELAGRLERWAADARVDEAARARARERWLRRQAEEGGTFAGVLTDLLESGAPVTVRTRSGGRYPGVVRVVGEDVVGLGPGAGRGSDVVVALPAVTSVRVGPGGGRAAVTGDRRSDGSLRLAEVLATLADDGESVRMVTADGEVVAGTLRSVGLDVAVVAGGAGGPTAYVPLAAVDEVVLTG